MGIADKLSAPDDWHRRLLRARRERPRCRRAAQKRDEVASPNVGHGLSPAPERRTRAISYRTLSLPGDGRQAFKQT